MRARAKPKVRSYRDISPEIDALSRQLQVEIGCSANELAERAIRALATAREQREQEPAT